jgi:5-formyltetrahydrofolate cyclo-ligase
MNNPAAEQAPQKASLRRHYRAFRQTLLPKAGPAIADQLQAALDRLTTADQHLGLYWPLAGEVDLLQLQRPETSSGPKTWPCPLALPAIHQGQLVYRAWEPKSQLEPDDCGIPAPLGMALPASALSCLLVPALAFDGAGVRLGYGGGWYDRLRTDAAWTRVPSFAVLPQGCLVGSLPRDPWDRPLDGWLDETGLHHCQP